MNLKSFFATTINDSCNRNQFSFHLKEFRKKQIKIFD
jgi:hypothetical protein